LRRIALVFTLLLAAGPAHAAGSGLRWNECEGPSNRAFACDRSTGSEVLVGSFQSPASSDMLGIDVFLRFTTVDGAVPVWWHMWDAGDCRRNSSSLSVDMSTETDCEDPWLGQATGLYAPHSFDAHGLDLRMVIAVPEQAIQRIAADRTYAAFRLTFNHARSSGAAACAGCQQPVCIVIEQMNLVFRDSPRYDVALTAGRPGSGAPGNIATWQGGTPSCGAGAPKSSTWSELKKRYK
jgi:hypothetical protein